MPFEKWDYPKAAEKSEQVMSPEPPRVHVHDKAHWERSTYSVLLILELSDHAGPRKIACRVSNEALSDLEGATDLTEQAAIDAYLRNKTRVLDVVERKLMGGHFEEDGSIVVRSAELNR